MASLEPNLIYESASTLVRRAQHDGASVISKSLKSHAATPTAISRYYHEFAVNQSLTSEYICRAISFDERLPEIILEDTNGVALKNFLQETDTAAQLDWDDKLWVAGELCKAVQSIHDEGAIHRDLNPANIIINLEEQTLKLIDFGLATVSTHDYSDTDSGQLTGTLPYISPEQTGRVNRLIDYRTDLYSLGCTLYELFSGTTPFNNNDPLELIHSHIARTAVQLHRLDLQIPRWLSEIVKKLLAKQPEDRYQTADAVRTDIEIGATTISSSEDVVPFELGQTDSYGQLTLPRKVYGRETEIARLEELSARAGEGESLIVQLIGSQGIGKQSLAKIFASQFRADGGLTANISGARENSPRQEIQPQSAPKGALDIARQFLRQVLSRDDESSSAYLTRLRNLGDETIDVLRTQVPELALVFQQPTNNRSKNNAIANWNDQRLRSANILQELLKSLSPISLLVIVEQPQHLSLIHISEPTRPY